MWDSQIGKRPGTTGLLANCSPRARPLKALLEGQRRVCVAVSVGALPFSSQLWKGLLPATATPPSQASPPQRLRPHPPPSPDRLAHMPAPLPAPLYPPFPLPKNRFRTSPSMARPSSGTFSTFSGTRRSSRRAGRCARRWRRSPRPPPASRTSSRRVFRSVQCQLPRGRSRLFPDPPALPSSSPRALLPHAALTPRSPPPRFLPSLLR